MDFNEILVQFPSLRPEHLHAALLYYFDHRAEVDALIAEAEMPPPAPSRTDPPCSGRVSTSMRTLLVRSQVGCVSEATTCGRRWRPAALVRRTKRSFSSPFRQALPLQLQSRRLRRLHAAIIGRAEHHFGIVLCKQVPVGVAVRRLSEWLARTDADNVLDQRVWLAV
jgi:hypothetical protein